MTDADSRRAAIESIVAAYAARRITRAAATWRLMFHARDWRETDRWLEDARR